MITICSVFNLNEALALRDYLKQNKVNAFIEESSSRCYLLKCAENDVFIAKRLLAQIETRDDYVSEVIGASWAQESADKGNVIKVHYNLWQYIKHAKCTFFFVGLCLLLFVLQLFEHNGHAQIFDILAFNGHAILNDFELWRLITPAIMHGSWLHLLFNIVMFNYLASSFERKLGSCMLLAVIIITGVFGNIFQYYLGDNGGNFLGLSGVVFGLIGFLAVASRKAELRTSLGILPGLFTFSLLFIVVAFVFLPSVASYCHLGGLLAGLVMGLIYFKPLKIS